LLFEGFLCDLSSYEQNSEVTEFLSDDLGNMLDAMIVESVKRVAKAVCLMTKQDRKKAVGILEERGILQLRRSVPLLAEPLEVAEETIYNHLTELERDSANDD
jgi:predicted transcriptional regulator YheO